MKKSLYLLIICSVLPFKVSMFAQLPAFPGAGGGGAQSIGGRGGIVYEVTNLNDAGPGSLREGVQMSGARTIVFRVGGTIDLSSTALKITNPYITIAGQTAPGDGVQISASNIDQNVFLIETHDVIIRYLRLRHGYNPRARQAGDEVGVVSGYNVVLDHCTMMWTTDENADAWGRAPELTRNTWSWNIIAEPLSDHPTNFLTGGSMTETMTDIDAHHNLFANSSHRNPLIKNKTFRFVNNIVYNWRRRASHMAGGVNVDFIGNLYKTGPLWSPNKSHEISVFPVSKGEGDAPEGGPSIYVQGNKGPYNTNPSNDNWSMVWEIVNGENGSEPDPGQLSTTYRRNSPLPALPVPIIADPVDNLETLILPTVGASQRLDCLGNWVLNRDATDKRIISEYNSGTGFIPKTENDVGGFPLITGGAPCTDNDHDGMPDAWEKAHGLDPNKAADGNGTTVMIPYTNLEAYLSGLSGSNTGDSKTKPNNKKSTIKPNNR